MYAVAIVDDLAADAEALARLVVSSPPSDTAGSSLAAHPFPETCRETAAPQLDGKGSAGQHADATDGVLASDLFEVRCFSSADELVQCLDDAYAPDIAFIDIVLDPTTAGPAADGIDAVERLLSRSPLTQIVYVSGYDAFHTQVYRTPHAAYLRKPFRSMDVSYALGLALAARERTAEKPLCLKIKGAERVIEPAEIRYLESRLHMVCIHAAQGDYEVYGKLADLVQQLPARFVRCHQSFIVNLATVASLDATGIVLVTGERVPVSRRMRAGVRQALFSYLRARRR